MGAKIVDLIGFHRAQDPVERTPVVEVPINQFELDGGFMRILVEMVDAASIE